VSAPFNAPTEIIGPVSAEISATIHASDTDVMAKLIVVRPNGIAFNLWTPSFGRDNAKEDYLSKRRVPIEGHLAVHSEAGSISHTKGKTLQRELTIAHHKQYILEHLEVFQRVAWNNDHVSLETRCNTAGAIVDSQ